VTAVEKPSPVPTAENRPYWESARQRKLMLPRCAGCGWYYPQPRVICANCHGEKFQWTQASGKGKIFSYTVVHQTNTPGFQVELPYVIVHVAIDEQPECVITTNLIGDNTEIDKLDINLPVVVDFEERGDVTLPQFRLA
jgi:uncharacterized protein